MKAACPQCGASITFPERGFPVTECGSCGALSFQERGRALEARLFLGNQPAPVGSPVALICRLCGGPFPMEALNEKATCGYCGHPAILPPTVRAALRLLARPAAVLPSRLIGLRNTWLAVVILFVAICAAEALVPYRGVRLDQLLPLSAQPRETSVDSCGTTAADPAPIRFRVRGRGSVYPYCQVAARGEFSGRATVRIRLTQLRTGIERSQWLEFQGDGPKKNTIVEFFVSRGQRRPLALPPGDYQIALTDLCADGSLPAGLEVSFRTSEQPPLGMIILLANLLIWLFVFDLRASVGRFGTTPSRSRLLRIAALLLIVLCLGEVVAGTNPFGPATSFPPLGSGPRPPAPDPG